jgi:hypothetical protein
MSPALHLWNKVAVAVVGLSIASLGVAMILWRAGVLATPASADTTTVTRLIGSAWWPWAAGVVGLVVVLLGIRWFVAYIPRSVATELALSKSDEHGDLSVSLSALASAMDDRIAVAPGVRRCNSSVRRDRGVRLVETRVHVDSGVHLRMLTGAVDDVARDVEAMLSGDAPATRVRVYVNRSRREKRLRVDSAASPLPRSSDSATQPSAPASAPEREHSIQK